MRKRGSGLGKSTKNRVDKKGYKLPVFPTNAGQNPYT
jgi:hypothetical protein